MTGFYEVAKIHEELKQAYERLTIRHRNLYADYQRVLDENVRFSKEVHELRRVIHDFHHTD